MEKTDVPEEQTIERRTHIDPGDFENALLRIINYLADKQEAEASRPKPEPVDEKPAPESQRFEPMLPLPNSKATRVVDLADDFNALLSRLRKSGFMDGNGRGRK